MLGPDTEFLVSDADPQITENGHTALVMLLTDKGQIALHMERSVLESLVQRAIDRLALVIRAAPQR
jgi:hypothetical protein